MQGFVNRSNILFPLLLAILSILLITNTVFAAAPIPPEAVFTSGQYKGDTFVALCSDSTDEDGDELTYYYQFESNPEMSATVILQAYSTSDTYEGCPTNANCNKIDDILVNCRASDGTQYSTEGTAMEDILNSQPTVNNIITSIEPAFPVVGDTLNATCSGSWDIDGDEVIYQYRYMDITGDDYVDIGVFSTDNTYLVQPEDWNHVFTVNCFDGFSTYGDEMVAVTVADSPGRPTPPEAVFTSGQYKGDTFVALCSDSTDEDGDELTYYYQFESNPEMSATVILQAYSTSDTYEGCPTNANCNKIDDILVNCRASDGTQYSTEGTAMEDILNSQPTVNNIITSIEPAFPVVGDTLNATCSGSWDIDGDEVIYQYRYMDITGDDYVDIGVFSTDNTYLVQPEDWNHVFTVNCFDGFSTYGDEMVAVTVSNLVGDASDIVSNVGLSLLINGEGQDGNYYLGQQPVEIDSNGLPLVQFDFDFDDYQLILSDIGITTGTNDAGGSFIEVHGVNSSGGMASLKTLYLYDVNTSFNAVCVKEVEGATLINISAACDGADEFEVKCDGSVTEGTGATCTSQSAGTLKISGLKFSALQQFNIPASSSEPAPSSPPPSGNNNGGGSFGGGGGGRFFAASLPPAPQEEAVPEGQKQLPQEEQPPVEVSIVKLQTPPAAPPSTGNAKSIPAPQLQMPPALNPLTAGALTPAESSDVAGAFMKAFSQNGPAVIALSAGLALAGGFGLRRVDGRKKKKGLRGV